MQVLKRIEGAPSPVGEYSAAVISNGMVYCSGQIALDPETGEFVSGGVKEQALQVLKNVAAVLKGAGSDFSKVAMTTIFLADISDAKVVNELYGEVVNSSAPPARQTVAVKDLPLGALVEISVIAEL